MPAITPPERRLWLRVLAVVCAAVDDDDDDALVLVLVAPPIREETTEGSSVDTLKQGIWVVKSLRGTYVISAQA